MDDMIYTCGNGEAKEPYHYTQCGLDNVYLVNGYDITIVDDEEYISIENIKGLWKRIGISLVERLGVLTAKEIRFLREHMGNTQQELGSLLGVDTQTFARWEKGKVTIPRTADLAMRTLFLTCPAAAPEGKEIMIKFFEAIREQEASSPRDFSAINLIRTHENWEAEEEEPNQALPFI